MTKRCLLILSLFALVACTRTYDVYSDKYFVSFSCDMATAPFNSLHTLGHFLAVRPKTTKDGYRVKSPKGILFRRWANTVLKEYLMKGAVINQRIASLESRMEDKFAQYDHKLYEHSKKIDFFIQSSLPPKQGIFFDGQIYDAYTFVADLVRKAALRIVLIDNYIDDTVMTILSKRADGVEATIYTGMISKQLQLDIDKHNAQYPLIEVRTFSKAHDRFLIIDDAVYLVGASIKDLGKKWFGFTLMENTDAEKLLGLMI